jgi:outer membrane cobalamin receptor
VAYNVRASYGKDENRALFQANYTNLLAPGLEGYQFGNSFNVLYDDVNTLAFFAELKVEISNQFSLGINGTYSNYSTDRQEEAWNLPELQASVFSDFNITEKLYGGASIFYVGERKDLYNSPLTFEKITLDGYVDANLHFGYRFTDRLSAFVKGSNLFGDNYQKWMNFPVQGIQGLAGVTYKFDW